jgi:hypothetical protein
MQYTNMRPGVLTVLGEKKGEDHISLASLAQSRVLPDMLYCLASGRILWISSQNSEKAEALAARLSWMSPFTEPFPIIRDRSKIPNLSMLQGAIVLAQDRGALSYGGVFYPDRMLYEGVQCPPDSVLRRLEGMSKEENDNALLFMIRHEMLVTYCKFSFRRCQRIDGCVGEDVEGLLNELKAFKFGNGDREVLRFWMNRALSPRFV